MEDLTKEELLEVLKACVEHNLQTLDAAKQQLIAYMSSPELSIQYRNRKINEMKTLISFAFQPLIPILMHVKEYRPDDAHLLSWAQGIYNELVKKREEGEE